MTQTCHQGGLESWPILKPQHVLMVLLCFAKLTRICQASVLALLPSSDSPKHLQDPQATIWKASNNSYKSQPFTNSHHPTVTHDSPFQFRPSIPSRLKKWPVSTVTQITSLLTRHSSLLPPQNLRCSAALRVASSWPRPRPRSWFLWYRWYQIHRIVMNHIASGNIAVEAMAQSK